MNIQTSGVISEELFCNLPDFAEFIYDGRYYIKDTRYNNGYNAREYNGNNIIKIDLQQTVKCELLNSLKKTTYDYVNSGEVFYYNQEIYIATDGCECTCLSDGSGWELNYDDEVYLLDGKWIYKKN